MFLETAGGRRVAFSVPVKEKLKFDSCGDDALKLCCFFELEFKFSSWFSVDHVSAYPEIDIHVQGQVLRAE